jgi:hypothetical protein
LSVIKYLNPDGFVSFRGLDLERAGASRLLSNASAEINLWLSDFSVITMLRCGTSLKVRLQWSLDDFIKFDLKSGRTTR